MSAVSQANFMIVRPFYPSCNWVSTLNRDSNIGSEDTINLLLVGVNSNPSPWDGCWYWRELGC